MTANSNLKTFDANVQNQWEGCERARLTTCAVGAGTSRGSLLESLSVEHQLSALTGSTECFIKHSAALHSMMLYYPGLSFRPVPLSISVPSTVWKS